MKKLGYLGPQGTFTHQVALQVASDNQGYELVEFPTMSLVLHAVEKGQLDLGVVPVENSIEGTVNLSLDVLTHEVDLFIQQEVVIDIIHNLVAKDPDISKIKKIFSHPQAIAQCRKHLEENFPDIMCQSTNSSGEAAVIATKEEGIAAITSIEAAKKYGLHILRENINDYQGNKTRFVVVGKGPVIPTEGKCKSSLVVALAENKPGGLYEILEEFAIRKINLTKIESRPAKKELGNYLFFIDCEVNLLAEENKVILSNLENKCKLVKVLGVYPMCQ